jgi:hypothetical protein
MFVLARIGSREVCTERFYRTRPLGGVKGFRVTSIVAANPYGVVEVDF